MNDLLERLEKDSQSLNELSDWMLREDLDMRSPADTPDPADIADRLGRAITLIRAHAEQRQAWDHTTDELLDRAEAAEEKILAQQEALVKAREALDPMVEALTVFPTDLDNTGDEEVEVYTTRSKCRRAREVSEMIGEILK